MLHRLRGRSKLFPYTKKVFEKPLWGCAVGLNLFCFKRAIYFKLNGKTFKLQKAMDNIAVEKIREVEGISALPKLLKENFEQLYISFAWFYESPIKVSCLK